VKVPESAVVDVVADHRLARGSEITNIPRNVRANRALFAGVDRN
jgi:hypothetical protein